ncbi:MAG: methionyl-tRNA formyltransferase [Deltaproteobacteria bacterium]|nr:methionyl-tRNA formyltransferase [Candidatus Anaeroferrophillacea bacterium]
MKVVLAASGTFAVNTLEALVHRLEPAALLVISQPDRPAGRGRRPRPTPVADRARELGFTPLTPARIAAAETVGRLRDFSPGYLVVVDYGQIVPPEIVALPRRIAVNIHPSLLPRYRGPAPVARALLDGCRETGVTIQMVAEKVDTGAILRQETAAIAPRDTTADLTARLAGIGARLLLATLDGWEAGTITPRPQDETDATRAPRLEKEEGLLDWTLPVAALDRRIRALQPWPGTHTFHRGRRLKIITARPAGENLPEAASPGTITVAGNRLLAATGDGRLEILRLQAEGRPARDTAEFLRGGHLQTGERFTLSA